MRVGVGMRGEDTAGLLSLANVFVEVFLCLCSTPNRAPYPCHDTMEDCCCSRARVVFLVSVDMTGEPWLQNLLTEMWHEPSSERHGA